MAKRRHTVRKISLPTQPTFEEQLWPVNFSVVILSSILAGITLQVLSGDDYIRMKWGLLLGLGASTALTLFGLCHLRSWVVRRGIQLSFMISLILHVILLVVCAVWQPLLTELTDATDSNADLTQPHLKEVVIPEYLEMQKDATVQQPSVFQKPVVAESPDPNPDDLRQAIHDSVSQQPRQKASLVVEPNASARPNPLQRQVPTETVPRQSVHDSPLSRAQINPVPVVDAPTIDTTGEVATAEQKLKPNERSLVKQPTALPLQARQLTEVESHSQPTDRSPPQRRIASENPTPTETATEPIRRNPAEITMTVPPVLVHPPQPTETTETTADPAPQDTQLTSRTSPSPETPAKPQPTPEIAVKVAQQPTPRQQPDQPDPKLASLPYPSLDKTSLRRDMPGVTEVETLQQSVQSPQPVSDQELDPSTSQIARQPTPVPEANHNAQQLVTPALSPTAQLSRAKRRVDPENNQPSITRDNTNRHQPRQTSQVATTAVSPIPVASPAEAVVSNPDQDSLAPSPTALTKGRRGMTGIGDSPNLQRSSPASDRPSSVASGSARRDRTSQTLPEGPAITPGEPALVARSRANAPIPSALASAIDVPTAATVGSRHPAEIQASSSAALERSATKAHRADVTASPGSLDVDIGPERAVSNTGTGPAAGGGQPELKTDVRIQAVPRRTSDDRFAPAIASTQAALLPTAPDASGAGEIRSSNAGKMATSVVRTDSGGNEPQTGQPAEAQLGEAIRRNSAQAVAVLQLGRTQPQQTAPEVVRRGGGTAQTMQAATRPAVGQATLEVTILPGGMITGRQPRRQFTDQPSATAGRVAQESSEETPPTRSQPGSQLPQASVSVRVPAGSVSTTEISEDGTNNQDTGQENPSTAGSLLDSSVVKRSKPGQTNLTTAAPAGPGGLAKELTLTVNPGIVRRRSSPNSEEFNLSDVRFIDRQSGGSPSPTTVSRVTAPGFQQRIGQRQGDQAGGGVGPGLSKTEKAVELGLIFLARHHGDDGRWSLHGYATGKPYQDEMDEDVVLHSDTAATGLSLMAFLGAGYHHQSGKYREVVERGLEFLIHNQQDNGDLYLPEDERSNLSSALYSHAIATMAICEAYGMTWDPDLEKPAQLAIEYAVESQHKERGGWRYRPQIGSDTSVTGWMMMALHSGRLAGLQVPQESFERIHKWIRLAQGGTKGSHLFVYNPYASKPQAHGKLPTPCMTSVGMLMSFYSGSNRDQPLMNRGADYLLQNLPDLGTTRSPKRDTYYWYYGTQVMYHMGGQYWEAWNSKLYPLLVENQITEGPLAGSWHARHPIPDRWGIRVGRLYVTAMNLLSLEIEHRHLPIYADVPE